MAFKTILVHVNDERRVAGLIDAATSIGSQFGAHVVALYVMPPIPSYGPTAFGAGLFDTSDKAFRQEAARVHAAFEEACRNRPIVPEWRLVEPGERSVADCVLEHGHTCDLIIAGQRDPSFDLTRILDVPERLVMASGRPVLLIPRVGRYPVIGRRVTVAWSNRREASRAAFDALPLLRGADTVRVIAINPGGGREGATDLPTSEMAAALARHGVRCEAATSVSGDDISTSDVLLSGLTDDGADLLVMGAWGHSRVREMVFGGVTQHILAHMTVPVLMSH